MAAKKAKYLYSDEEDERNKVSDEDNFKATSFDDDNGYKAPTVNNDDGDDDSDFDFGARDKDDENIVS